MEGALGWYTSFATSSQSGDAKNFISVLRQAIAAAISLINSY
jgi:hypothetical protein